MSKAAPASAKTAAIASTTVADTAREKNIELAVSSITKQFGEGSIMRLGDAQKMKVETLSTGSLAVDLALGVGGLPKGRIIEIYGPESSGKTTFCLSVIAEAQKRGGGRSGGFGGGGSGFGHGKKREEKRWAAKR